MNGPMQQLSFPENLVDVRPEPLSLRAMVGKVFLRPKLFLFAVLVPPLIAMLLVALVPTDWSATTKILIRYGVSDTSLLRDISPDIRLGLSGTTSAELIKSTPVVEKTIEMVGITEADIYRKPTDVLSGMLSGLIRGRSKDAGSGDPAVDRANQVAALARSFKDSLDSSSKKASSTKSVEILDKPSQMPDALKLDELISLEVRSFNREKVAAMTNGLARAFIDEYYRIYGDEARRQYLYLDGLVTDQEKQLAAVQSATREQLAEGIASSTSGKELVSRDVPILNNMAAQLMEVQGRLTRANQVYSHSSPEVRRLQSQTDDLKFMLARQERIEIGKQVLEQLKLRRYQAFNTQTVYKDRLIPISIAEFAMTPKPSSTRKIIRVLTSGVVGAVLGVLFATTLMIVLSIVDPRIHVRRDVEALLGVPVIGQFAERSKVTEKSDFRQMIADPSVESGVLQMLTSLNHRVGSIGAQVLAITTASKGDGGSMTAFAFASNIAKNRGKRVCLLDANLAHASLSRKFGLLDHRGFVDAIRETESGRPATDGGDPWTFYESLNLSIVPAGLFNTLGSLGYYADAAKVLLDRMRIHFDTIVIDTGPVLTSNEAIILGQLADQTLLVASAGMTRKGVLKASHEKLNALHIRLTGVVLNRTRNLLPGFLYRNLF